MKSLTARHKVLPSLQKAAASLVLLCAGALSGSAVPAFRGTIYLEQPDGSCIAARMHGDEYNHYFTTEAGVPLVEGADGFYTEADADPETFFAAMDDMAARSRRRAYDARRRMPGHRAPAPGHGYGLFPGTSFPSSGSPRALVLLVDYDDVKFTLDDPLSYFSRMMNEEGFNDYGGTGSALDYFTENSGGRFTPQFDVFGPVHLSQKREYYGDNKSNGDDIRPHMMAVEACRMLDSKIDFSKYDNDGDGVIDNVFIFYAGEGESKTGVQSQVWPHTGFVSGASPTKVMLDGVQLDRYACSNEWHMPYPPKPGDKGRPDGVGTFVHEFSHVMGLPDLYSTRYNKAFTPGSWSALDYGPYNNGGCTPPNYSVFERYALGWLQPRVVTGAANVRLEEISHNQGAMVPTPDETEFFLFENRQQNGWDKYIPGHGMLVWHVDYDDNTWAMNAVNNTVTHQCVDLEEADGMGTEDTRADDAFPSSLGRTEFNDNTIPSMLPWNGRSLGLPVSDITERPDGVVTFKVAGGRPDVKIPVAKEATEVTPGGFRASWTPSDEPGCTYTLSVYSRTAESNAGISYAAGYNHRNVGKATEFTVSGLASDTQYYYTVSTVVDAGESEPSNEVAVRTEPPTFDYLAPTALEPENITADGFTARWEALRDATEYFIHLSAMLPTGHLRDCCDFTDGLSALPAGWATDANSAYGIASNCGAAAPSLRFTKGGQSLQTPVFTDGIHSISFWLRGVSTAEGDGISLAYRDSEGSWAELSRHEATTAQGGATVRVDALPEGCTALRITAMHTKGSIALDDVTVEHGMALEATPVAGYDGLSAGNATSLEVKGLTASTPYTYRITATDGTLTSLPSETISLTTTADSGVKAPAATGATLRVEGRTATLTGVSGRVRAIAADGHVAAQARADATGICTITLPATGIYIIEAGGITIAKVIIK